MSWRDRLRPASWRGIPFFVENAEAGFSRNVVEHEYPGQAPPFFEDLGRRARSWTVEGYILGDDYQDQRDRLVDACDSETGPGELVHPYFGTLRVLCRGLTVRESAREGRMGRLLFQFVEASEAQAPGAFVDPSAQLLESTTGLFAASANDFADKWNGVDSPATLLEAGAAQAASFWDKLRGLQLSGPIEEVGAWRSKLEGLADSTTSILRNPHDFAESVSDLLAGLVSAVGSRKASIEAFLGLLKVNPTPSYGVSSASRASDENRDAVRQLFRENAAALAARSSGEAPWTNYDDALQARTRALDELSSVQDDAGDQAFRELANVSRSLVEALPLAPGTLPRIEDYDVPATTSSLVLAYQLFDDVSRAGEITDRNDLPNGLAIPGGIRIEVLSRV